MPWTPGRTASSRRSTSAPKGRVSGWVHRSATPLAPCSEPSTVRHETVTEIGGFAVVLMDSISLIGAADAGTIIVCGSHGGRISGAYAQKHPPALVVFNDAGIGRREAGIASLQDLDEAGIPAAAISCDSA